jgi:hypothetical protein
MSEESLNTQVLVFLALGMLAAMGWYANYSMRDKILIYYNRANKTQIVRWVKMQSRYVIFDHKKFDIISSRIVFRYYTGGFIYWLFPQWVATLIYSYNSRFPHDPNHLEINSETPEVRDAINKAEWVESYYKGAKPSQSKGGKLGMLQQYLPWIAILLVVIVAIYFNSKMTDFGHILDQIVTKINAPK